MNFLKKLNKKHLIIIAVILVAVVLVVPQIVDAWSGVDTVLLNISSWIANQIIFVVGQLLLIAISILIKVAGFNEFVDANIVQIGWVIVRDVANLAIVISLLIIAFYTVINKQSFHYKTMLPKLILAAILVNFSKSIAGLLIDFGQVFMMYFVHAFENIAAGNLTYGFGIEDMMSIRNAAEAGGREVGDWNVFGALVLAVIMVVVALGVVVSMAVMLLYRIIMLWILIIFSPIAYVAGLIPGAQKYSGEWWSNFGKNITFGPVLAFMFWLSMTVLSQISGDSHVMKLEMNKKEYLAGGSGNLAPTDYAYFASQVSSPQRVFDYMVTVGLLIACLMVAKQSGVAGAEIAGKWQTKMEGAGKWIAKRPQLAGKWAGKKTWQGVKAGTEATKLPAGVRALGQRMKTSKAGRLAGLDKEYTAEQRAERDAIMTAKWGGERGKNALRQFEYQQSMKKSKEMEERGEFMGGEDLNRIKLHDDIKAGKWKEVNARRLYMANSKDMNLSKLNNDFYESEFRKQTGIKRDDKSRQEEDYKYRELLLINAQKASGDVSAKYKSSVRMTDDGLGYVSDTRKESEKDFDKKKENDFNNPGLITGFNESIMDLENHPEFLGILDALKKKDNMQAVDRGNYAKILQSVLARHHDKNDSFKLENQEVQDYEGLLQKMHARQFERVTGRAIIDVKAKGLTDKQKELVEAGNEEFVKATGYQIETSGEYIDGKGNIKVDGKGKMIKEDDAVLNKVSLENKEKAKDKKIDKKNLGRDIPDVATEETEKNIIAPLMDDNKVQEELYDLSDKGRSAIERIDAWSFRKSTINKIEALEEKINEKLKEVGNEESNITDPKKGTPYTRQELYDKSDFGESILSLKNELQGFSEEQYNSFSDDEKNKFKKYLKNHIDGVVMDAQRASGTSKESIKIGRMEFKEDIGDIPQSKRIENRKVNRNSLGLAVGAIGKLNKADLKSKERKNVLSELQRYLKQAKKHSQKHNKDNVEFNEELEKLEKEAKKFKTSDTISNAFESRVKKLLSHVEIK